MLLKMEEGAQTRTVDQTVGVPWSFVESLVSICRRLNKNRHIRIGGYVPSTIIVTGICHAVEGFPTSITVKQLSGTFP